MFMKDLQHSGDNDIYKDDTRIVFPNVLWTYFTCSYWMCGWKKQKNSKPIRKIFPMQMELEQMVRKGKNLISGCMERELSKQREENYKGSEMLKDHSIFEC